jgi:predicted GNAT family acetyltransferase
MIYAEQKKHVYIMLVCTHKDFKNKGYATKLMNQFINDMRKKGKTSIILSSVENAVSYYQKLEFEAIDDNLDDYPYLKNFELCSDDKFTTIMEKIL